MNNIIPFTRGVAVTETAIALARAIVANGIGPDELFAAIDIIFAEIVD